ncbi:AAA family ATPase [Paludisphaera borealis]|uniref:ATP-dependent zinc metalloprotease FtsH n=1 Tax=Paludisphaera borealis TaxID=1387353 RepID=A0A1U7CZK9_9BACT|nr:ATP-binding protein [Paludisphaera borealis]APW64309.1 ATP-dependent zinc metalloprotease FtsH [Paludisphaera borealis]
MATAEQLKALLRSYSDADGEQFISVALQIAAHAARTGKSKLAEELKILVQDVRQKQRTQRVGGAVPIVQPSGELAKLLAVTYPSVRLSEMVLSQPIKKQLHLVLREYKQKSKLREHGLSPRRKLLLVGPPGCGKTMTSRALAGELKLPHLSIQLHSLITKFMGETAAKLHSIFELMPKTRGVYLFDEFDAIGSERAAANDVGEIRRVLNSFLQFLEQDDSDSIIVAATNLASMLDEALFRRFDEVIHYEKPTASEAGELILNRLARFGIDEVGVQQASEWALGLSYADICQACDAAAKESVLKDSNLVELAALKEAISQRQNRRAFKNEAEERE